jgi:MOSC domain-containing protein YiiM
MSAAGDAESTTLVAVNTGRPQIVLRDGRQYSTAIHRRPTGGRIALGVDGLEGDRVADRNVHGGPDKAVCCFPHEHYSHFARRLGVELPIPSFGENFTTAGLLESEVCVGDTFRVGSAFVQVSQPRQPCFKLAGKHREPRIIKWIYETGYCGFYFRVLQPGEVGAGDEVVLIERGQPDLTIHHLLATRIPGPEDRRLWERLAALPALSASWRDHFAARLRGDSEEHE